MMYSAPGEVFEYHISRFTLNNTGMLDMGSEKVMLSVHEEHSESNHTGVQWLLIQVETCLYP